MYIDVHPTKLRVKDFNYCFCLLVYLYFETLGIFLRLLPDREILQCAVHNIYAQKVPYLMNIVLCSNSRLCCATLEKSRLCIRAVKASLHLASVIDLERQLLTLASYLINWGENIFLGCFT